MLHEVGMTSESTVQTYEGDDRHNLYPVHVDDRRGHEVFVQRKGLWRPGDWVRHRWYNAGFGIVVARDDLQITVLWSQSPFKDAEWKDADFSV